MSTENVPAPGVTFEHVVKTYDGGMQVLHGIDLAIARGEFVVFVGPSGCGKSTLMRMVAGLEAISGGRISIDGRVVNDLPPRERDVAMVFQDYALYPHKSVYENLAFGLRLRRFASDDIDRRVKAAATLLKIDHLLDRRPRALSGGQRQRVAMGRAIVREPKVFLFDEPLSNLDALLRAQMRVEIKKLHQRMRTTSIYVTHDQVEAMTLAERIVVLSAGRVMQVGTPDEIYNRPASRFVAGFTGSPPMNFLAAEVLECTAGRCALRLAGSAVSLYGQFRAQAGDAVTLGVRPEDVGLAAPGATSVPLAGEVVVLEPLGAETQATIRCAAGELVARLPAQVSLSAGTAVTVWFDPGKVHLFSNASGESLRV